MNCSENKCLCEGICGLSGNCILSHELFEGYRKSVLFEIRGAPQDKREAKIVELLQAFQPPKINGDQINNYYRLKKKGINLDKPKHLKKVSPVTLLNHRQLGIKSSKKKRSKVLHGLKSDDTRSKKELVKNKRRVVSEYLKGNGVYPRNLSKEEKKIVYTNAARSVFNEPLDKSGKPIIILRNYVAEALREPEPNFHYI